MWRLVELLRNRLLLTLSLLWHDAKDVEIERDDQVSQFAAMVGACCESARLARLRVQFELEDGSTVQGVPSEPMEPHGPGEEFDHSGTRNWLVLDGTVVMTARIRTYCVVRPE